MQFNATICLLEFLFLAVAGSVYCTLKNLPVCEMLAMLKVVYNCTIQSTIMMVY